MGIRGWVGLAVLATAVVGCSGSHYALDAETCHALWTYLNANSRPAFYMSELQFDAEHASGRIATDGLALSTATSTTDIETDTNNLENACDAAGYHFRWASAANS